VTALATAGDARLVPPTDGDVEALLVSRTQSIGVCIPARNEAATVGRIVRTVQTLRAAGLVDDLLVVDDGSHDATAAIAGVSGARVVRSEDGPGKGQALTTAISVSDADVLVFLDADVTNLSARYVTGVVGPLLARPEVHLVKAAYRRPCDGRADEGGRVTELLARPLLRRHFPDLADLAQPLAGECAVRRRTVEGFDLADGYGVEIGLLIDVRHRFGRQAIAEADLGERAHRNRPLLELGAHADAVLAAVLDRAGGGTPDRGGQP
jgi:glucosyl-3-phosphoglycerate synthase